MEIDELNGQYYRDSQAKGHEFSWKIHNFENLLMNGESQSKYFDMSVPCSKEEVVEARFRVWLCSRHPNYPDNAVVILNTKNSTHSISAAITATIYDGLCQPLESKRVNICMDPRRLPSSYEIMRVSSMALFYERPGVMRKEATISIEFHDVVSHDSAKVFAKSVVVGKGWNNNGSQNGGRDRDWVMENFGGYESN